MLETKTPETLIEGSDTGGSDTTKTPEAKTPLRH